MISQFIAFMFCILQYNQLAEEIGRLLRKVKSRRKNRSSLSMSYERSQQRLL